MMPLLRCAECGLRLHPAEIECPQCVMAATEPP